jgi:hypothetical protein
MSLVYGVSTDKELTWIKFEIFVWVINGEYFGCKLIPETTFNRGYNE